MQNVLKRSFAATQSSDPGLAANSLRPKVIKGGNLDDVLKNYVRSSTQVNATVSQSVNGNPIPSNGAMDANLFKTLGDRRDIKNILAMNPNAELAIDIVVNGTLSPNNTLEHGLQYQSSYDRLGTVKPKLLQKIQDVMNGYVDLDGSLAKILREAKYDCGSYAMLVIPMNKVKKIIQDEKLDAVDKNAQLTKMESYISDMATKSDKVKLKPNFKHIDIKLEDLGFKAEEFTDKVVPKVNPILIHDNLEFVGLCNRKSEMAARFNTGDALDELDSESTYKMEDVEGLKQEALTDAIIDSSLDRARSYSLDDVLHITPSEDYESNDLPLYKHVNHEAIFVVHRPGSPDIHEYYYIVMDMTGNPVSVDDELGIYMPTYSGTYGNSATESAMGGMANFSGGNSELGYSGYASSSILGRRFSDKSALFNKLMEGRFKDLVENGFFKHRDITISRKQELMDILFSRLCANKQTQIICVPASLMTYVAFDYDENGNGQSLIIKHKNIGILNSILTLANTLAAINNTIDYKKIRVDWDGDGELDYNKIVEGIAGNLARYTTLNASRLMNTDVNKQIDFLGQHGYQWEFGEHPQFPSTNVTIENLDRERTVPDPDIIEKNEALLIQGIGSTPEVVDAARNVEFASSYFQSNLQAARRAIADQKILCTHATKFIKSYVLNAPILLKWMIKEIDKARPDLPDIRGIKTIQIVREFVNSIKTALPKPDMVKVEILSAAFEAQEKLVDNTLKYVITEEALDGVDVGENLEDALKSYQRKLKAYIMREWMANNNMFKDGLIKCLYTSDQEEVDSMMGGIEGNQKFVIDILKKHKIITDQVIKKANDDVAKVTEAQGLGDAGGSTSTTDTTTTNDTSQPTNDDNSDPFAGGGIDGTTDVNTPDNTDQSTDDNAGDPMA